ncbi:DUF4145 domain-containing protein [Streptococcus ruminantium]|uniref:DUF4145 domain-containing protein n=1 Tax=Streptococcus ruminantium TaxID=1917441 RepID=UPI0012DE1626|nr:DUF4145 domain-containing protein [Streptococcus ruminantium]
MKFDFSQLSLGGGFAGNSKAFQCPNCSGFASHLWKYEPITIHQKHSETLRFTITAQCQACEQFSIWLTNELPVTNKGHRELQGYAEYLSLDTTNSSVSLIFPDNSLNVPAPNSDMPSDIKEIFIEAGQILDKSPRASAALSRLAIEKLVGHLEIEGKDLNSKIGKLVSKGMPIEIQQMLDSVRVIGNNAVHPGQIDITDNKELALSLLYFINLIIDNRITQPKKISEIYHSLPESYREAIKNRDS